MHACDRISCKLVVLFRESSLTAAGVGKEKKKKRAQTQRNR